MLKRLTPILLSTLTFLLGWHLLTRYSGIPNFILPSPLSVWTRFLKALNDGSLLYHTSITLSEIVLGLLAGVLFAIVVGYVLAKSRSLEKILSPYLVASQAIPIIAIAPLLVIWLGDYGILSKVVICALIVFFPVLVNTIVSVRAVPTALYDLMNSLRATRAQILWKVEVPASLPVFLGGLRIGATLSVIGRSTTRCEGVPGAAARAPRDPRAAPPSAAAMRARSHWRRASKSARRSCGTAGARR